MSNGELKSAVIVTAFSILLLLVTTFFLCYNYDRLAQRLPPENAPADKRAGPKQEKLHPNEEVIEEYYRRVTKGKQDMPEELDRRLENIYKKPEPEIIPFANDIRLMPGIGNNDHNGDVVIMEVEPFALPRDDFGEDDSSLESPFKIGGITIPIQAFPFGLPFNLDGGDNMIGHDDLEDEDYPDLVFPENEPLHFNPIVLNEPSSAVNQLPEEKELKPTPKPKPSGSTLLVRLFDNHPTTTVKPPTTTVKPPFGKPPPIPKPRLENNKNNPVNDILSAIEESSVEDDSDEDLRGEDMLHRLLPNNLFGPFF